MPEPRRWQMLPVILIATFMGLFDFFVVNVAAPSLQSDLSAGESALELIVGGYAFTYASGLVTGGRLGDLFSYRRLFIVGMSAFTVASVLCGLAQNSEQLIVFRLLQGLTAAAMVPQVLALITASFPADERPKAVSWFGVTMGIASVAGQVLGGLLLDADLFGLGWRAVFLVNLPVGMVTVPLAIKLLPRTRATTTPRLDPAGSFGLAVALGLALAPLVLGRNQGWPTWTFVSLALSVPALAAVIWYEHRLARRGGQPVLDLSLFRHRHFNAGLGINMLMMFYFGSYMLGLTLFLQAGLHLGPLEAGLVFGPLGIMFGISSVLAQRLVVRFGSAVITAGALVTALALVIQLTVLWIRGTDIGATDLLLPMTIMGLGSGLAMPALIGAVLARIEPRQAGAAAGVLTTGQQFSIAAGVAVIGTIFFSVLGDRPVLADFVSSLEVVTEIGLVLILSLALLTVFLRPRPTPAALPDLALESIS
jgi:EmrB/QacA subfamily drug resistance transporter